MTLYSMAGCTQYPLADQEQRRLTRRFSTPGVMSSSASPLLVEAEAYTDTDLRLPRVKRPPDLISEYLTVARCDAALTTKMALVLRMGGDWRPRAPMKGVARHHFAAQNAPFWDASRNRELRSRESGRVQSRDMSRREGRRLVACCEFAAVDDDSAALREETDEDLIDYLDSKGTPDWQVFSFQ